MEDILSVEEQVPVEDQVPVEEQVSVEEQVPVDEQALADEQVPEEEQVNAEETAPAVLPPQSLFEPLRREANIQGGVLLIYHVILNVVVFIVMFAVSFIKALEQAFGSNDDMQDILDGVMDATGWGYLLAVGIGMLILLLWKKPSYIRHTICQKGRPMTCGSFFALLSLAMAPQMIAQLGSLGLQWLMNLLGLDLSSLEEMANVDTDTVSMFLYVGIAAPITEELLFRGLLLRSIAPYNKKLAILSSALLFGLYHGNPIQTPYAILVGLVLGYVALEYHVIWAIALHLFNNLVFALLLPKALAFMPLVFVDFVMWLLTIGFFLAALLILVVNWDEVRLRWKEEQVYPRQRRAFFGSPTVIILIIVCAVNLAATTLLLFLP